MRHTEIQIKRYSGLWEFFAEFLPDYYRRNDVLEDDILNRFDDDEEVSDDDLEWIDGYYHLDKTLVKKRLSELETQFAEESLKSFYEEISKGAFKMYNKFWEFIEEYLPNYDRRDDVLYDDILLRFVTDDEVSEDDMEWIERDFHSDKS